MNIIINSVGFDTDMKLEEFIYNKVQKLNQVYDNIFKVEVFLRLENTRDLNNKISEIKVEVPGTDLFVKKQAKSFEESTDRAISSLLRQLKKRKSKRGKR